MRSTLASLALALSLSACASHAPTRPAEIEAYLQKHSVTVVRDELLTLYSPYDADVTREYELVLHDEARRASELFGQNGAPPVRIYLIAVADDDPRQLDEPLRPGVLGSTKATAVGADFAVVYVPRETSTDKARLLAGMNSDTLRHELAHLGSQRAGVVRGEERWFHEGLAQEVAAGDADGVRLDLELFPRALLDARRMAATGAIDELLTWRAGDALASETSVRRYALSHALFRFLFERANGADGASFVERTRELCALDASALRALEPEWLAWLSKLDALEAVRRGTQSSSAEERGRAASRLPSLAEAGAPELRTRAADELALALLGEPSTRAGAATFLCYFRERALTDEDLRALETSSDAARRVTACALRARRGERVDLARARASWDALEDADRSALSVAAALIRGLDSR